MYTGGLQVAYLLTLAIGVLTIGSEYRHQTITSTFLAVPKRAKVMTAKVVALLGIGAGYGAAALASSFAVGAVILAGKGHAIWPDATIGRTLALGLLVLGLWALIGLGIGILIPNQIAALFIAVGVAWIVEPLLTFLLSTQDWGRSAARFFPSSATDRGARGHQQPRRRGHALELRVVGRCVDPYRLRGRHGPHRDRADRAPRRHLTARL